MTAAPVRLDRTRTSDRWSEARSDQLNLRAVYPSGNTWGIPDLPAADWVPDDLVAYSSRSACATAGPGACVHFFLDDYRFEVVWSKPERALSRIGSVGAALTPDFSMWSDMPMSMQLWQVYRARWCGCWLAAHGIRVIPTLSWSTPRSYAFAFLGVPLGSVVAVSTVGIRGSEQAFMSGYAAMVRQIRPATVIVYGQSRTVQALALNGAQEVKMFPSRWALDGR